MESKFTIGESSKHPYLANTICIGIFKGAELFATAYGNSESEAHTNATSIANCEKMREALIQSRETIKWMLENCKPVEDSLYTDFFNIPNNTLYDIDEALKPNEH